MDTRNKVQKAIHRLGSDWLGEQIVRLGNDSGDVETGTAGEYFARQYNGKVIRVINAIYVSPKFDTRVLIRRSRIQPTVWRIAEVLEDYPSPVGAGAIAHHHGQHEESGPDRLTLSHKQIKELSVRAAGALTVQVYGAAVATPAGVVFVNNELINLASYAVPTGAIYVSIESDEDGVLSVNDTGTPFAAPNAGTDSNIPAPAADSFPIAYVLLYEGQTEIIDNHIRPIVPLPGAGGGGGSGLSFNDAEGDPAPVSSSAPADGTSLFAARRDHVHYLDTTGLGGGGETSESHEHKLARWNGLAGNTTFDLPEFADSIEWLAINGLIEDPFVYTLASDGSQVVLDTALASDQNVSASYTVRSLEL